MDINLTISAPNGIKSAFVVCTTIDTTGKVFASKSVVTPKTSSLLTMLSGSPGKECFVEIVFSNDGTRQNGVPWEIIGLISV